MRELLINAMAEHGIHARGRTGYAVCVPFPRRIIPSILLRCNDTGNTMMYQSA